MCARKRAHMQTSKLARKQIKKQINKQQTE